MGPGDLTYPQHIEKGLGRYLQSAMNTGPDFGGVNQMFSQMGKMGPMVRGGQFIDPSQAQQEATGGYLSSRGNIEQNYLGNLFQLAALQGLVGKNMGNIAAMIPELQAQQVQAGSSGIFGGLI